MLCAVSSGRAPVGFSLARLWHVSPVILWDAVTREQEVPMMLSWFVTLLAAGVLVGSRAVANGYLIAWYSRRHRLILMERGADGLHHVFTLAMLPLVLIRYTLLRGLYSLLLLRDRAHAWAHGRKSVPLAAKA